MKQINQTNLNDSAVEKLLEQTAGQTNPNQIFQDELERQLKLAHQPKKESRLSAFKHLAPVLGWAALIILMVYGLSWAFKSFAPFQLPASNQNTQSACPVTQPNGNVPPGENVTTVNNYLGNDKLWTALWPNGKVYMLPDNQRSDGSFDMKWWFWRGVTGPLTIEGHRLDAEAEPLRADIPGGYGDSGFQVAGLIFPTTGCWEVTAHVGDASLTFITEVLFGVPTPTSDSIITPDPNRAGFDFRGAKLIMSVSPPKSPAEANVYLLPVSKPVTEEYAQTLAGKFGITGQTYKTKKEHPTVRTGFMVTDGKQQLIVYGENDYTYVSDMVKNSRHYEGFPNDSAETIIADYLKIHGLDFAYQLEPSDTFGGYALTQLSPDGFPVQFESFSQPSMRVTLDENGNILNVTAMMINFDPSPVGSFGIISAEDALNKLLDDTLPGGKIETGAGGSTNSGFTPPQTWYNEYPDNQTVTINGSVISYPANDAAQPAVIFLDNVPLTGNTAGMDALGINAFVVVSGQYVTENGIRYFMVDTWDSNVPAAYLPGSARRNGDKIELVNGDGSGTVYELVDPPTDLPLDTPYPQSTVSFIGAIVDGKFYWNTIQYFADSSQMGGGGGGGGGGLGFYQFNPSGTPIPFPTPTPSEQGYTSAELVSFLKYTVKAGDTLSQIASNYNIPVEDIVRANGLTDTNIFIGQQLTLPGVPGPTRLEGDRGTVMVTIFVKPDGRQRVEYTFLSEKDKGYYQLTGNNLEPLQKMANRPVDLWGAISIDKDGQTSINVEKYEEPFPDLQTQVLSGTQETIEINGEQLVLFNTGGKTYVLMANIGSYPDSTYYPDGGEVLIEALAVPDETYAGYPAIRAFSSAPAINPITGQRIEFPPTADIIEPIPDPYGNSDQYIPPDITIDKVELVYFVSNPAYRYDTPDIPQKEDYIQPAWHFLGHTANGGREDFLIQALRQEYLLPDISPAVPPG